MQIVKIRFGRYLLFAGFILLFVSCVTCMILLNSRSAVAADNIYVDLPLDHPSYQMCRNMINLGAITPRAGQTFAPFEKITAEEWNYALQKIGTHLGRAIPQAARFTSDHEISGRSMLLRLHSFVDDTCGLASLNRLDHTRISAFFLLEHCLLAYIND